MDESTAARQIRDALLERIASLEKLIKLKDSRIAELEARVSNAGWAAEATREACDQIERSLWR